MIKQTSRSLIGVEKYLCLLRPAHIESKVEKTN